MSLSTLSHAEPLARPSGRVEPTSVRRRNGSRAVVVIALVLVLAGFAVRAIDVARSTAITSDETTHLTHCLHYWMTGDDLAMWELGAPRLPHALYALPTYLALKQDGRLTEAAEGAIEREVLSGAKRVTVPARLVAVAWGLGLLGVVFWGVARVGGSVAALVATTLVSLVPEVVAHSAIAGSDVPFTAAAMLAVVLLTRWVERPTRGRWVALGLAIGLAWAMRHSALILLVLAGGAHAWLTLRKSIGLSWLTIAERLAGSIAASAGLGLVAAIVLWAGDGFEVVTVADVAGRATAVSIPERIGPIDLSDVPMPSSTLSFLKQVRHQNKGHEAFFLGAYREQGWPLYFPIAFLLKTPTGLLALMVLAAARIRARDAWDAVLLAALAVLWLMLVRNKVNIGVRYALLTYPLAIPFVARLFELRMLRDRAWGPITVAAALWFTGAAMACHPGYLSYFNEIGGGPSRGWMYLADSNIDWGQDFDRIAPTLRRLGIDEVTTDVTTSERRLEAPGLSVIANPHKAMHVPAVMPPNRRLLDAEGGYLPVYSRYVAVSVTSLHGLYTQNDMSWLRSRRLVERIGDSVFLFDMDRPAERPLCP